MVRPKPHRAQPTDSNRGSQRLTFATTGTVLHLRAAALTWPMSGLKNGRSVSWRRVRRVSRCGRRSTAIMYSNAP
jgi:hypothetical protein